MASEIFKFESVDGDGRRQTTTMTTTDDGPLVYYKLTLWAFGSGELINLVMPEYPMLYTKFQGYQPLGSEEGDFLKVFTVYGPGSHLVMWPGTLNIFSFQYPLEAQYEIWLQSA